MRNALIIILLAVLLVSCATNDPPRSVTKYAGLTSLGNYRPRNVDSLADLPSPVRERVIAHLQERLGTQFYRALHFTGGQIIDFEELQKIEPNSKNYRWEVHAYDLYFEFRIPAIGIKSYTAQIQLRSDGGILHEIDLPSFNQHPQKLHFVSLSDALKVVANNGFNPTRVLASIAYSSDKDILIWQFSEIVSSDTYGAKLKNAEVDAHTGEVVRIFPSEATY